MHRVLQTPELVSLIIDLVHYTALPTIARTCSDFFDPAARAIWKKCHTLVNLAMCLPESCWKCSGYQHGVWGFNSKLVNMNIIPYSASADPPTCRLSYGTSLRKTSTESGSTRHSSGTSNFTPHSWV